MKKSTVTRRDFIKLGTGAAASGLAAKVTILEPMRLAAAPRPVPPSDTIRFAILGTGVEGCSLLRSSLPVPGIECVAAADLYDGRHIAAREALNGKDIETTREYRRLIDRKDIDAIICATPDHWHRRVVEEACQAGKDVYCEKPMSHTVEDGKAMVAAVSKYNRICEVGSQRVSNILYAKAKEIWDSGKLGMVDTIQAAWDRNTDGGAFVHPVPPDASPQTIDWDTWLDGAPPRPFDLGRFFSWRRFRDYGAGLAGDLFVHLLSGIHFVTGTNQAAERAYSSGGIYYYNDGREFPDLLWTLYDYPKFKVILRCNSNNAREGEFFRFFGKNGTMAIHDDKLTFKPEASSNQMDDYTIYGWPKKLRDQYMAEWMKEHPQPKGGASKAALAETEVFATPPTYNDQTDHLTNFFHAVRTRQHVVEDEVFGSYTAIGCHMSNQSYFSRTAVVWDAAAEQIKNV
jgi:predicted dehydrogenase